MRAVSRKGSIKDDKPEEGENEQWEPGGQFHGLGERIVRVLKEDI